MNPQQQEKIKNLIATSPLLTSSERQDWLSMLDLMNDKQVGELEKILTPAAAPVVAAPVPSPAPAAKTAPAPPAAMPSLSHIVNLPKDLPVVSNFTSRPASAPPPKIQAPASAANSNFSQRLAAVLKEKELIGQRAVEELELPASEKTSTQSPKTAPPIPTPSKFVPPVTPAPARPAPPPAKPAMPNPAPSPRPVIFQRPAGNQPSILKNLDSVQRLTLEQWHNFEPTSFLNNLKSLAKDFGYHKLIFSLEHSLLYKVYIDTGLELLKQTTEEMPQGLMTKSDFEAFADLLRSLPSSLGR